MNIKKWLQDFMINLWSFEKKSTRISNSTKSWIIGAHEYE